ncbi:MAG: ThuA domain-containing protein, partial [Thermoguttaceae bacterium]
GNVTFSAPGDLIVPYIAMLFGEFFVNGPQQKAKSKVVDPMFPGADKLGESFDLHEEWYTHKKFAKDLHVILVQETEGMKGDCYQRPPYPSTWARMHGKGRVFYTSMGHREDVWTNQIFQDVLLGGFSWVLKNVDADVTPNIDQVTPKASLLRNA